MIQTKAIYPDSVRERACEIFNGLKDSGYTIDMDVELFFENLCKFFLEKWLAGDEVMEITEDECDEIFICSGIDSGLQELIDRGLLDTIEDEDGNEILWATEKGKKEGYEF